MLTGRRPRRKSVRSRLKSNDGKPNGDDWPRTRARQGGFGFVVCDCHFQLLSRARNVRTPEGGDASVRVRPGSGIRSLHAVSVPHLQRVRRMAGRYQEPACHRPRQPVGPPAAHRGNANF